MSVDKNTVMGVLSAQFCDERGCLMIFCLELHREKVSKHFMFFCCSSHILVRIIER